LKEYLTEKQKVFPRFYFASEQALLDILSNGNNPEIVDNYVGALFDGMKNLQFVRGAGIQYPSRAASGMISNEGEIVPFTETFKMVGAVENYLNDLEKMMVQTLMDVLNTSKSTADQWDLDGPKRHIWLEHYCAQIALLATQIIWTEETEKAFDELESGSENSMKDSLSTILRRLDALIERVRTDLDDNLRIKIITVITIDVQERDVISNFVAKKITDMQSFQWQQKLRFYIEKDRRVKEDRKVCNVKICDWQQYYNYEYVGNCGRLVITNLTDRCYITLTQALNLSMGAAPAGPAGTGKTETTKDLGRALGLQVQVFNCSDQMNYTVM
jgi:dynein heavy chain